VIEQKEKHIKRKDLALSAIGREDLERLGDDQTFATDSNTQNNAPMIARSQHVHVREYLSGPLNSESRVYQQVGLDH
jgi:hypothetical protein